MFPHNIIEGITDEYGTVINSKKSFEWIANNLIEFGYILIAWTDEQGTQFDILFTRMGHPLAKMGPTNGGIRWNDLYVSIMRIGAFGFAVEKEPDTHVGYFEEKFRIKFGTPTGEKLADLINRVRSELHKLDKIPNK